MKKDISKLDERAHLIAQIDALCENMGYALKALEFKNISEDLRLAVKGIFFKDIDRYRKELIDLKKNVKQADFGEPQGITLRSCWSSFARIKSDCDPVFNECFDFLEGALFRTDRLDYDLCFIADSLLKELQKKSKINWDSITILGDREDLGTRANIIHIRFPEFSIWDLPIVAHELGHLLEFDSRPSGANPVSALINRYQNSKDNPKVPLLREHISDLFGVYTLGLAYAYTCIFLNFKPLDAFNDQGDHPSDSKRAYFIIRALEKLNGEKTMCPYIDKIKSCWDSSITGLGLDSNLLRREECVELDGWLNELCPKLDNFLPNGTKYWDLGRNSNAGWQVAYGWFSKWNDQLKGRQILVDRLFELGTEGNLSDALNAAWLCRIKNPKNSSEISRAAKKLCMIMIKNNHSNSEN